MSLSDRHKAFIDEYLTNGMNARQAYLKVYPDCKTEEGADASASKILSNPKVKEYLKENQKKIQEEHGITREWIKDKLVTIIDDSMPMKYKRDALTALQMLAKMYGLNEPDKLEHSGSGINFNIVKDSE